MKTVKRKKQQSDYKLRVRGELKIKLLAYLIDHPCVDCGEKDSVVLTFDHVRGVKKSSVANMVNDCESWSEITNEIEKCEVRCMNCHMRKTAKQLNFWKQLGE